MEKIYDSIIVGGGPAGLSAGIYAGRAMLDVLLIEKGLFGGQIGLTNEVVNYPGIIETSGYELGEKMKEQAEKFGVKFASEEVLSIDSSKDIKIVKTTQGEYKTLSVILATGATPRKLNFKGEDEYIGRGVAFCATCDGEFFTGMDIFVVGAGFAAAEEAIFLTKYAKKVYVIAREPEFTCAKSIGEKVAAHDKIEVRFNTEVLEIGGDMQLRWAKFKNNVTNEVTDYKAADGESFGMFIFVGYEPQSKAFKDQIDLDKFGYISTDEDLMTSTNGIFAAGDIRPKRLRQVVTAVSDGGVVGTSVEKYVLEMREKLGMKFEKKEASTTSDLKNGVHDILDSALKAQMADVIERFENNIEIVVIKDSSNEKSAEMEKMMSEIADISDKIKLSSFEKGENPSLEEKIKVSRFPTISILDKDGNYSGLKFSGLPSGHELNSFILAMYNVAGPGQKISEDAEKVLSEVKKPINIKVGVSLTCTKCPDTVQSSQRVAVGNKNIEMEMIDVFTFKDFKEKYDIMSVPAMVVNDKDMYFGQKNIEDVLEIIKNNM